MYSSKLKFSFSCSSLLKKLSKNVNDFVCKTCSRESIIPMEFVGLRFKVYNGKNFVLLPITEDMVGFRLGEFVMTRSRYEFKKKKKKKK